MSLDNQQDIIIVGGGPVGLWTASQIKLLNPQLNILILEKHENYKRSHFAFLEANSFELMAEHPNLMDLKNRLQSDKKIKTSELEETLFELCNQLGVQIIKGFPVECGKEIEANFPGVQLIIGADGAHSTIRKTVCSGLLESELFKYSNHFHTLMEVKYQAIGETKPMDMINIGYPLMKHIGVVVNEIIGKQNESGNSPITLQFFVNENIGESIKNATFKNPIQFHSMKETLPNQIRAIIEFWLAARFQYYAEKHVESSVTITSTKLGSYASRYYVRNFGTKAIYCLVGDAAFGMPFFRSLNNGLLCATILAQCVVKHFEGKDYQFAFSLEGVVNSLVGGTKQFLGLSNIPYEGEHISQPLIKYASYAMNLEESQLKIARAKSIGLKTFQTWTKISAIVPWQVNKLRPEQLEEVRTAIGIFSSKDDREMYDDIVEDGFVLVEKL